MGLREILGWLFPKRTASADPQRATYVIGRASQAEGVDMLPDLQRAAVHICKDYIASSVAKCEFRTFLRGAEVKGDEYYLWNVAPNPSQTSTEFWREAITRLYDEGEVLIVPIGNHIIIADSFCKWEKAVVPTIYTDISRGDFRCTAYYTSETAIRLSLPDELTPRSITEGLCTALSSVFVEAMDKYRLEGGERGTYEFDSARMGDEEYNKRIQQNLDEDFAAYFKSKNAVLPIYDGTKYTPVMNNSGQKTSIVSDITGITEQIFTAQAQAYKIPPALILGSVADTKTSMENYLSFCIDPLVDMITEAINRVRYGKAFLEGSYIQCDTSYIRHIDGLPKLKRTPLKLPFSTRLLRAVMIHDV